MGIIIQDKVESNTPASWYDADDDDGTCFL